MESKLNKNFETFCKYLGAGNINSKIWFVGVEEGGKPVSEKNLEKQLSTCKKGTQFFDNASSNTPVWNIISTLLYDKFSKVHKLNIDEYREKLFSKEYSYFFLTELFPLPKINISNWPENYFKIFGYNNNDYYKYLSDIRSYRYPIIFNKWNEVKPKLTICFGVTFWNEFINLFKLSHSPFEKIDNYNLIKYSNENIVLAPFFNNRTIKTKEIDILKQLINDSISISSFSTRPLTQCGFCDIFRFALFV